MIFPYLFSRCKSISSTTSKLCRFQGLGLPQSSITFFSRLCLGHNLFPSQLYCFFLNSSPICTFHSYEATCNIYHILFIHLSLSSSIIFFSILSSLDYSFPDTIFLLNYCSTIVIFLILNCISHAGFPSANSLYLVCT